MVTFVAAGYTGTVDEIAETRRFGLVAPPFRVASVNDWLPSADVGVNRQVNITAGQGAAYGVAALSTTIGSATFAANVGSQNRFDALVVTFAWAANAAIGVGPDSVTLRVITGTSLPPQSNGTTSIDNTKMNHVKGVQYDALIAIVRVRPGVGLFSSGDVVDCRMWAGFEGYANTGSAQYLTSLDTQPGSLVRAVDTDIVWNRLSGGAWGFEKWTGTDKTKQPMYTARLSQTSIPHFTSTTIGFTNTINQSGGLLSGTGTPVTAVIANVYGRVRVEGHAFSDGPVQGGSHLDFSFPAGGGNYLSTLSDERQRESGYNNAGQLRQSITTGPLVVAPGDSFGLNVFQYNPSSMNITYDLYLSVTYV